MLRKAMVAGNYTDQARISRHLIDFIATDS